MQNLLNTALLGTTKQPMPDFFTQSALRHAEQIAGRLPDTLPEHHTWQAITPAPKSPDERLLPDSITLKLKNWLHHQHNHLLNFAFHRIQQHGYVLPYEILPLVLSRSQWRHLPVDILGQRGVWLLQHLHPQTNDTAATEEDWTLLPHAQRKQWLAQQRQANPDDAREQLQTIWASTPANQRQEYLETFHTNLSHTDIEFLTQTLKDRSKNIRELAQQLLLKLPDSPLAQQHFNWLRERLHFDKNKWHQTEVSYSNELKSAGIDELSPHKNESDIDYQLRQIIQRISLTQWSNLLNTDLAETIHILINHRPCASLNRADWVQTIDHPDFTYAMLRHSGIITKTSKDATKNGLRYLAGDLENAFNSLPIEYKEQLLADYPDLIPSGYYNIWEQQPLNQTWGEHYSQFILNYLMNHQYYQGVNPENIAVYLANTPKIHEIINHLPKLIEQDEGHHWKRQHYQTLFDSYMERVKFDTLLTQSCPH